LRSSTHASGFSQPLGFVQDPSDRSIQFVVEKGGRIRALKDGVVQGTDFLNLTGQVSTGSEQGLLGLAFAPDYATSRRFFVNFTNTAGDTVVARYRRSGNPLVADSNSRFDLRFGGASGPAYIDQPYANHNGGNLVFGPDGYLYIGMGDGGAGDDPENRAQNPAELLGKMLRIDVNVDDSNAIGYRVPADNPFVGGGARPEIWSFGLRNPWKYSFDDPTRGGTGALVIADVGQDEYEEIDYEPFYTGARNYGWRYREGAHDNVTSGPLAYLPLVDPIYEYDHTAGQSITGGFVYRGHLLGARYRGRYFFADFVRGRVWSLSLNITATGNATVTGVIEHTAELGGQGTLGNVSAFGVDSDGELYIVSYSRGIVIKVLGPNPSSDFDGDGKGEVALYRPSNGLWLLRNSMQGYAVGAGNYQFQWGLPPGDIPQSGDFDGDGRRDLAVYRPSSGEWYIRNSSNGYSISSGSWFQWGLGGDTSIPADYDGDGRTDPAVYRPSSGEWFIRKSSTNYATSQAMWLQWGLAGDVPRPQDYDGDGKADVAVYRPSTGEWFIRNSSNGYSTAAASWFQWGLSGDVPVSADFDGDGKADIAVYRPSTGEWYIRYSSAGYVIGSGSWYFQWGLGGDTPQIEDFDGDGKAEITVYRPSTGEWFIRLSSTRYQIGAGNWYFQWGLAGDVPALTP
jgi:glucose/arabinose dehydrogenase